MGDVYPYTASSTSLRTLLPGLGARGRASTRMLKRLRGPGRARAHPRASWRRRRPARACSSAIGLGERHDRVLPEAARTPRASGSPRSRPAAGIDPLDAVFELLSRCRRRGVHDPLPARRGATCDGRSSHPAVMIGSDGSALAPYGEHGGGKPHPRSYGTFPRVLGEYAREQRVLTLPQAVHKMTALPARRLGLRDRGEIRVGARADLVVFDAAPRRRPRDLRRSASLSGRASSTCSSTAAS